MHTRFSVVATAIAVSAAVIGTAAPALASDSSHNDFHGSPQFSVALGDSLAYGYQQALFTAEAAGSYDPSAFVGYAGLLPDPVSTAVQKHVVNVNFGCPGETTASFSTSCVFTTAAGAGGDGAPVSWLHVPYTTSQQVAALAFLSAHKGRVADVTIDLGSNDLRHALFSCVPAPLTCGAVATAAGTTVIGRLVSLVTLVEQADPGVPVAVANFYNPEAVDTRLGPLAGATDALAQAINAGLAGAIGALATAGVPVRLADAFTQINGTTLGGATETTRLCSLTNMCGGLFDIHPSDAGYAALSQAFSTALQPLL